MYFELFVIIVCLFFISSFIYVGCENIKARRKREEKEWEEYKNSDEYCGWVDPPRN